MQNAKLFGLIKLVLFKFNMKKYILYDNSVAYLPRDYFQNKYINYHYFETPLIGKIMKIIHPELKARWSEDAALGHETLNSFCSKDEYIKLFYAWERYKSVKAFL